MTIRILIADDHTVVAEGLKHLIEAQHDLEVVSIVGDGREAVRIAKESAPNVVLMDLSMPELNGADATRAIVENDPKCRVDRKSTRLNSSHRCISYAVFCLK